MLKDGSAAAIYGTRGTNGVILITTKSHGDQINLVEYNGYISTSQIVRRLRMLNGEGLKMYPEEDHGANTNC